MKHDTPLISVIIPIYNVEKYMEKCLDSVLNQTLKHIEIVCINDGSTDNSLEILKRYAEKDERIKMISRPNKGLGATRNDGVRLATGEYLFFLDSDDWIDETCLEKLYNKAKSDEADLCIYGCTPYNDDKDTYLSSLYYSTQMYKKRTNTPCDYRQITDCVFSRFEACLKLWKRDFFIHNELFFAEGVWFEDVVSHIKGMILAKHITFVDENLCFYRQRSGSIMNSSNKNEKVFDAFIFLEGVLHFLKEQNLYKTLEKEYSIFVTEQLSYHYGRLSSDIKKKFKERSKQFVKKHNLKLRKKHLVFSFLGLEFYHSYKEFMFKIGFLKVFGYKTKKETKRFYFCGVCLYKKRIRISKR